jgi:hypothetical protein
MQIGIQRRNSNQKDVDPEYRFSEDFDFTILDSETTNESLESATEFLFPWLKQEANLVLEVCRVEVHSSGNPTFYLNCGGPLQGDITSCFLKWTL